MHDTKANAFDSKSLMSHIIVCGRICVRPVLEHFDRRHDKGGELKVDVVTRLLISKPDDENREYLFRPFPA